VLERSSTPVAAADRLGWKDTVGVLPDETVTVLAEPDNYAATVHALTAS
jgi:FtsP/CotA-like multicopper oxidase with cupredoxin domain